jgi:nitrous oxide reductase
MTSKAIAVIFVGTLILAALVLYYSTQLSFASATETTSISGVGCTSYSNTFTIIASQTGYNDSVGKGAPSKHWPLMCVHLGEAVKITIVNEDTVEPHGFAITHYDEAGVTLLPGRSTTITFFADTPGDFKIFCNVICAVHIFMQSGLLIVTN